MQNELSDAEVVRLIAYVKPIQLSEDEDIEDITLETLEAMDDLTPSEEYLIDFLTVQEAKKIGSNGLFTKVAEILFDKNVIKKDENKHITWRLIRDGDLTPNENQTKKVNEAFGFEQEKYQVIDLRHLH